MNYDCIARLSARASRRFLPLFSFSLLIFFSALSRSAAWAHTESITVPCSGPIEAPQGGLRASSDGDTWSFEIIPGDHTELYDQHWFFNGLAPDSPNIEPGWGTFGGGGNSFDWISPTSGGTYSIKVQAKRRCTLTGEGGGGGDFDPNFEIDWGVDVQAKKTWSTPTPLTAEMASPAGGLQVAPGDPVTLSVTAADSDHWTTGEGGDSGDDADDLTYTWSASGGYVSGSGANVTWTPPNETGIYTMTCVVDDEPKDISPIDDGTRDDDPVTLTVHLEVPPRTWSTGASIGAVLDDKGHPKTKAGVALENGRLVAPSNQTVPKPEGADDYPTIIVRPGAELPCTVEEASDWDHWKREGVGEETDANHDTVHGDEEDEVNYTWSAPVGSFKNGHTGTSVTWVAPKVGDAGFDINQEYTITCTLDDKPATVAAPDVPVGDTARDDGAVTRTFKVKVVDDTSWMELSLHRDNNGTPVEDSATGTVGGKVWIAVDVQVGGASKISSPSGTVYLRLTEHDGLDLHGDDDAHGHDEHAWLAVPIGGTGWQTWNFDTANQGANPHWNTDIVSLETENTENSPKRYRYWIPWQTTSLIDTSTLDPDGAGPLLPGKLLGHNASHTVELQYSVQQNGAWQIKDKTEFQSKGQDGNYQAAKESGPNRVGTDVGNLVITKVMTNAGNADYFEFDPDVDDMNPLKHPTISFDVSDEGDSAILTKRYHWYLWVRQTTENGPSNFMTYEGDMDRPGHQDVIINQNGANYKKTSGNDLDTWGTYAFDLRVVDTKNNDIQNLRSYEIDIPNSMIRYDAEGNVVLDVNGHPQAALDTEGQPVMAENGSFLPGHDLEFLTDENDSDRAEISYILHGKRDASQVRVDLIDPSLTKLTITKGLPIARSVAYRGIVIYHFPDDNLGGIYKAVFVVSDSYREQYRDHENKTILAVNKGTPNSVQLQYQFSGYKRVVDSYLKNGKNPSTYTPRIGQMAGDTLVFWVVTSPKSAALSNKAQWSNLSGAGVDYIGPGISRTFANNSTGAGESTQKLTCNGVTRSVHITSKWLNMSHTQDWFGIWYTDSAIRFGGLPYIGSYTGATGLAGVAVEWQGSLRAANTYPSDSDNGGQLDICRHTYWNALMVAEAPSYLSINDAMTQAKLCGDAHEVKGLSDFPYRVPSVMDLENNWKGITIGQALYDHTLSTNQQRAVYQARILNDINAGNLTLIDDYRNSNASSGAARMSQSGLFVGLLRPSNNTAVDFHSAR